MVRSDHMFMISLPASHLRNIPLYGLRFTQTVTGFDDERARVSPEGLEEHRRRPPHLTAVRGMVAILAVLAMLTLVLVTGDDEAPVAGTLITTPPPDTTTLPPTTTTVPYSETLGAAIPEVRGRLVAAVGQDPIQLVTWAGNGAPTTTSIPVWAGPEIRFDRSGDYMAFLGPAEAGADSALYVGTTTDWHQLAVQAESFRWHARDGGRVAWSGGGLLCQGRVHPGGGFTTLRCLLDVEGRLLGFDDAGFLLGDDAGAVIRLDDEGGELGRATGTSAMIGADGRILLVDSGQPGDPATTQFSVAEPDLDRVVPLDWAPEGAVAEDGFVAWSPASSPPQLAFLVPTGDDTWEIQHWSLSGRLIASRSIAGRYWEVEWDWLGRYVLSAGVNDRGEDVIQVFDTDAGLQFALPAAARVQDIDLVRDPDAPLFFDLTSVMKGLPVK